VCGEAYVRQIFSSTFPLINYLTGTQDCDNSSNEGNAISDYNTAGCGGRDHPHLERRRQRQVAVGNINDADLDRSWPQGMSSNIGNDHKTWPRTGGECPFTSESDDDTVA
jgi:hypothetical protein